MRDWCEAGDQVDAVVTFKTRVAAEQSLAEGSNFQPRVNQLVLWPVDVDVGHWCDDGAAKEPFTPLFFFSIFKVKK